MQWSDNEAHDCEKGCKRLWEKRGKERPCATCKPEHIEANDEIIKIFKIVRNQLIIGFDTTIDLNHLAIWKALEKYQIENEVEVFEKIIWLWHELKNLKKDG